MRIEGGDLVPGPGGFETITGPAMVAQDLRGALLEPLGNDRFHPGYGSTIDTFIGQPQTEEVLFEVEQEVVRVTDNYAAVQDDFLRRSAWDNRPARSSDEIFARVGEIIFDPTPTRLGVNITIQTIDGSTVAVDAQTGAP